MRAAIPIAAAAVAALAAAATVSAQPADVPALIELVENQPAGVDRVTWKEQRRDAAKKLGASGDPRAVPVLIRLVEEETFDIIGEIAIEGLGQLGDPAAIPVLQAVVDDSSRDLEQRDKARRALAKLGAQPASGGGGAGASTGAGAGTDTGTGTGARLDAPVIGGAEDGAPSGPTWDDDVLAATERLTFIVGGGSFAYDTVTDRLDLALDGRGWYERRVDRLRSAYRYGADADVVVGAANPEGRQKATALTIAAAGHGEYRAYSTSDVYAFALGRVGVELSRVAYTDDDDPNADNSDRWLGLDVQAAIGGGWGRVLDVGARMRVARIATALERSRALGRPIDDAVAQRLQAAWWALRGELGTHRRLTATVAILRDAGILLGEPDAGTTYELNEILRDAAFDGRMAGIDVNVGFAESYLVRSRSPEDEDAGVPDGRYEQAFVRAAVARQLGEESDAGAELLARIRVIAPDGQPAPWAVGARARLRTFVYSDHFDPTGAFDLGVEAGASDDDLDSTDLGWRLGGELGWSVILSRASAIRVSAAATLSSGELFVGARLEATYGLLDGVFARSL